MRLLSAHGLDRLKVLEGGFQAKPYDCGDGKLCIGYGHVVHDGDYDIPLDGSLTEAGAETLLKLDVAAAERAVRQNVHVPLSQPQFDALTIFAFNIGTGAFAESTLLRLLNDGHYDAVPEQLVRWHFVRGEKSKGLLKRRLAEIALWKQGEVGVG